MSTKATTNVVKTTILVVVASLLAAGVYFGINRIQSKPPVAPNNNQFVEDLDELVKRMGETMDGVGNDGSSDNQLSSIGSDYAVFSHKLQLYKEEQLIDASEYDAEVENLNGSFAQKYANYYLNRFRTSEWSANDINNIRIMVKDLTLFSKANGTLAELEEIIDIFDKATVCANDVECRSAEMADKKNKIARQYLDNQYIKNNPILCAQIRSLPQRLAENHYEYIVNMVNELRPSNAMKNNISFDRYRTMLSNVLTEIDKYEKQREGYGANWHPVDDLRKTVENHLKKYKDYNNR